MSGSCKTIPIINVSLFLASTSNVNNVDWYGYAMWNESGNAEKKMLIVFLLFAICIQFHIGNDS